MRLSLETINKLVSQKLFWLRGLKIPPIDIFIVLFAFSSWPFFWYANTYMKLLFRLLTLIISVRFFMSGEELKMNAYSSFFSVLMVLLIISTVMSPYEEIRNTILYRFPLYIFLLTVVTVMVSIDFNDLVKIANKIISLYVIISIPSIMIFISFLLNIDMPYLNIELGERGNIYRLYPFGIILEETIVNIGNINIVRLNGFSEEPGVMGTYVVFFLILNRLIGEEKKRGKREIFLHILGILSMSLFYFISAFIMFIPKLIQALKQAAIDSLCIVKKLIVRKRLLTYLVILFILLSSIMIFFRLVQPGNPIYYLTIARFQFDDELGWFRGDSRAQYNERIFQYLQDSDIARVLIGNGPSANSLDENAGFASWGAELYDSGLLSLLVIFSFYLYILVRSSFYEGRFVLEKPLLLAPAVLSFYQRPETIAPIMLIFWVVTSRYFCKNFDHVPKIVKAGSDLD